MHRIALYVLAAVVLVEGYYAVFRRRSDFDWHLNLGQSFLAGDPYRDGGEWYPLGRAMFDGALAAASELTLKCLESM